ncbi:hypothetical protein LPC10_09000 [Methylorubrum sp. B1-46]|uniref:DUF6894 family protein n=1 Tax=Methylorubrum sp. B1-46 TaxID=2897334 RepID=UPI001E5886D7|nr:hypothetical protein [Methylorubrum sp. B1-46]UGB27682.1 hypothetical protein LPC10_09000 [Methylorubrum sp. B1-46]
MLGYTLKPELTMPRYFFNVNDGLNITDDDGLECASLDAALREAVRYAGSLLQESGNRLGLGDTWSLEVTEEATASTICIDLQIRPCVASAADEHRRSAA